MRAGSLSTASPPRPAAPSTRATIIEITFGNRPVRVRVLSSEEPRTKDVAREMYEILPE
jgi:ribosomal 50S subunit-recycling heat shock protein